jgi:toxin-antitoxin system PIN domain toxin
MIVPDVNLLVYAYSRRAPMHLAARKWWEATLDEGTPVGIPWAVLCGFIRVTTHPAVLDPPLRVERTLEFVRSWLERPGVRILEPGPRHLEILASLLTGLGVAGNLTTDAHLAAIAIEHQCEILSNDTDFGRFPGLRWHDPLRKGR